MFEFLLECVEFLLLAGELSLYSPLHLGYREVVVLFFFDTIDQFL